MKIRFTFVLLILTVSLFAKEVPLETARTVAENFLLLNVSQQTKSSARFELGLVQLPSHEAFSRQIKKSGSVDKDLLYVFSINEDEGFIIISADDNAIPVLAYSLENQFDPAKMPANYQKWIEGYKNQIRYIKAHPEELSEVTSKKWEDLIAGKSFGSTKSTSAVSPLVTTQWNQSPYVNELCPYDATADEKAVTGCAATAMAQIMKYWNYPEQGSGYHSYQHELYGALSANFASVSYDWSSMPNVVNAPSTAVATLMYHCGVSIDMSYGVAANGGSGAYVITSRSPIDHCVEYALKTYFNYDASVNGVIRENYSTSTWVDLLKAELDGGRPIEYAGFGSGGGHAFVCDGFDTNDFFHFNWGWGGYYDGYFSIDALDPGGTGIGGGSGGYNSGHQALIGIKPPGTVSSYDLALYDELTISENPLFYSNPFTLHTDVANFGTNPFSGDFSIALFDKDYVFVEFAEILEGYTLNGESHYTSGLDFTNPGSLGILPGDYYAGAYYRPSGGNWQAIGDGSYTNLLEFNVYYPNDIELYSEFLVSSGTTITQEESFTVTLDIVNDGTSTFYGEFAVDMYDMEGEFATTVQTLTGAELDAGFFYDDLVFTSEGISVDPGTYLLALTHKATGGDWVLSGSSYATNPIKVIVKAAPINPDMYEDNDSEASPYELTPIYSGNAASLDTEGSNSHLGTDLDFYKVSFETGYNYSITARVHDSYSSGNGQVYTNDVVWTYAVDGTWSELYDDVMTGGIALSNGGVLLFGIGPYFEGETGNYLLDIQISRSEIVSAEPPKEDRLRIYPNPATNLIQIESDGSIDLIEFYDVKGRMVFTLDTHSPHVSANISGLSEGVYLMHVTREDQTSVHKIVKQ